MNTNSFKDEILSPFYQSVFRAFRYNRDCEAESPPQVLVLSVAIFDVIVCHQQNLSCD